MAPPSGLAFGRSPGPTRTRHTKLMDRNWRLRLCKQCGAATCHEAIVAVQNNISDNKNTNWTISYSENNLGVAAHGVDTHPRRGWRRHEVVSSVGHGSSYPPRPTRAGSMGSVLLGHCPRASRLSKNLAFPLFDGSCFKAARFMHCPRNESEIARLLNISRICSWQCAGVWSRLVLAWMETIPYLGR
jgi:hypothetical protein